MPIEQEEEQEAKGEGEAPKTERPPEEPDPGDEVEERFEDAAVEADVTSPGVEAIDPEATVNLTNLDIDQTVNLTGDAPKVAERDDATVASDVARTHLKGLLEALIFASDKPIKANELAKTAQAVTKQVKELLEELRADYASRGVQLDEVAGGWIFRTNAAYAPFVRDLTKQKPVKLTRAQIETLSILAYRQPITRPEIDDIRGVDSGPVLKVLLERDLVKILGKKDEPGRPLLYGTTHEFLEFFGLKSLKDLPTLREFTDLTEESRRVVERELGETLETTATEHGAMEDQAGAPMHSDTLPPAELSEEEHATSVTEIPPAMSTSDDVIADANADAEANANADADAEADAEADADADADAESGERDALPAVNPDDEAEFPDDDDSDFDDDEEEDDEDDDEEEDDAD